MNGVVLFAIENSGDFRILKSTCENTCFTSLYDIVGRRKGKNITLDLYRNSLVDIRTRLGELYILHGKEDAEVLFAVLVPLKGEASKAFSVSADKRIRELMCDGDSMFCLRFEVLCRLVCALGKEIGVDVEYTDNTYMMLPGSFEALSIIISVLMSIRLSNIKSRLFIKPTAIGECCGFDIFFNASSASEYAEVKSCVCTLTASENVSFAQGEGMYAVRFVSRIDDPSLLGLKYSFPIEAADEFGLEADTAPVNVPGK